MSKQVKFQVIIITHVKTHFLIFQIKKKFYCAQFELNIFLFIFGYTPANNLTKLLLFNFSTMAFQLRV